jgi:hypothetical protein
MPPSGPPAVRMRSHPTAQRLPFSRFAVANPHAYRLMFDQMLELELSENPMQAAATFGRW